VLRVFGSRVFWLFAVVGNPRAPVGLGEGKARCWRKHRHTSVERNGGDRQRHFGRRLNVEYVAFGRGCSDGVPSCAKGDAADIAVQAARNMASDSVACLDITPRVWRADERGSRPVALHCIPIATSPARIDRQKIWRIEFSDASGTAIPAVFNHPAVLKYRQGLDASWRCSAWSGPCRGWVSIPPFGDDHVSESRQAF